MLSAAVRVDPPSMTAMRDMVSSSLELSARPMLSRRLAPAIISDSVSAPPTARRIASRFAVAAPTEPDQTSK